MRNSLYICLLIGIGLTIVFCGCGARHQSVNGLAVVKRQDGKIAHEDVHGSTEELANTLRTPPQGTDADFPEPGISCTNESRTQKKVERVAIREKEETEAVPVDTQAFYETDTHSAAPRDDLTQVKSPLDSGTGPGGQHLPNETGPLVFVVLGGIANVVWLLIKRDADADEKIEGVKLALSLAKRFKRSKIVTLFKQAGAE